MQQFHNIQQQTKRFISSQLTHAALRNLNHGTQIAQCGRAPKNQSFTAGITGDLKANEGPARGNKEVKVHET